MVSVTKLDDEVLLKKIRLEIQNQIEQMCEPIIKQTLELMEKEMRQKVTLMAGVAVDKYYEMRTNSSGFEVVVRLRK
jgi:hypothetical protein